VGGDAVQDHKQGSFTAVLHAQKISLSPTRVILRSGRSRKVNVVLGHVIALNAIPPGVFGDIRMNV
jgi:hypothetical protein